MWRPCAPLLIRMLDNASKGDRLRLAKHVERKRVARLRTRQSTEGTNAYHKAQYINAFVEAKSLRLSQAARRKDEAGVEQSLLALVESHRPPMPSLHTGEKGPLSLQVKHQQESGAKAVVPWRPSSSHVLFGAWREGSPPLERACLWMDRNLHRIVRGATTPAAFSPESLQRSLPLRLACMERLLRVFEQVRGSTRRGERDVCVFAVEMFSSMRVVCGGDVRREEKLMALVLQRAVAWDWAWALQLYSQHILPYLREQHNDEGGVNRSYNRRNNSRVCDTGSSESKMDLLSTSISTQIAVLCESIRLHYMFHERSSTGPAFHEVSRLVQMTPLPLRPVAAAPLFSILRPDGVATWRDVLTLANCFQPQEKEEAAPPPRPLFYLPSIAWAELLRAMHRMGATQQEVQSAVDMITDPQRTKHADALMRDTNVWNAYLAVSEWKHALDVFSNNLKHYGVREVAATSAALMESLLRDKQWEKALEIFHSLQTKEGSIIIGTTGVFTAVFNALTQKGDWHTLTLQLIDFDHFLIHLGVPHTCWADSPLRSQVRSDDASMSEEEFQAWMSFARELLYSSYATPALVNAIRTALIVCDPRKTKREQEVDGEAKRREGEEVTSEDMITAESLYDLL